MGCTPVAKALSSGQVDWPCCAVRARKRFRIGDERVGAGLEMSCDEGLVGLRLARHVVTRCRSDAFASAEHEPEDRKRDQSRS